IRRDRGPGPARPPARPAEAAPCDPSRGHLPWRDSGMACAGPPVYTERMRRFPPSGLFIAVAAALAALILTVVRPAPEGLVRIGFGDREVRAAPGQTVAAATQHDLSALDVFNVTLVRIRDAYVDPGRIDPKKMLFSALDSVQFNVPEVL